MNPWVQILLQIVSLAVICGLTIGTLQKGQSNIEAGQTKLEKSLREGQAALEKKVHEYQIELSEKLQRLQTMVNGLDKASELQSERHNGVQTRIAELSKTVQLDMDELRGDVKRQTRELQGLQVWRAVADRKLKDKAEEG